MHRVAAEEAKERIRPGPDGIEDVGHDQHPQAAASQRCRIGVATVGDADAHAGHEDGRGGCTAENASKPHPQPVLQVDIAAIHHCVAGHHEYDCQNLGGIDSRLTSRVAVTLREKFHWIKRGDTPLVLLFLSPIPMFSFTFFILNGVGGIIPKQPR